MVIDSSQSLRIESSYRDFLNKESHQSVAIATLKTLMKILDEDNSTTVVELRENVRAAIEVLKDIETCVQVESVSEIFLRFITLYVSRYDSFAALKVALKKRSEYFLENGVILAKQSVAKLASKFIANDSKILVHSRSMTVFACLKNAHEKKKNLFVYVTESRPDSSGRQMCDFLSREGIPNQLITDASIGIYLEKVDMVMVGAEGVCASGGILNKVGTYPMAICARAVNKPFYVVAESYKFIRLYPLNQSDVPSPTNRSRKNSMQENNNISPAISPNIKLTQTQLPSKTNQFLPDTSKLSAPASDQAIDDMLDYTPQAFITLILTDLGPLTTAAISDELMKVYL